MNSQNEQQEMQSVEEVFLDQATGGGLLPWLRSKFGSCFSGCTKQPQPEKQPWNFPFDSGHVPTTPAAENIITSYGASPEQLGHVLDEHNLDVLRGERGVNRITVSSNGGIVKHYN
jgi:hypothetical protein